MTYVASTAIEAERFSLIYNLHCFSAIINYAIGGAFND